MRGRWLRIFLLAFSAVWFGAIVPGHRRGCVLVAGVVKSEPVEAKPVPACHGGRSAPQSTEQRGESERQPARRGACAICLFATMIEPPAAPDVVARPTCTAVVEQWGTPAAAEVRGI